MTTTTPPTAPPGARVDRRWHPAWTVAAVTLGALVAAAAFRSSTGVLLEPLEMEFGWSRTTTSGAVTLNLVLYGLVAPFAAAFMEKWGIRRTVSVALLVVGLASAGTIVMKEAWQLWLLWGVAIGVGTGMMALVFGAIVANRWFVKHRGLVMGVFSAANATGQLIFLLLIAAAATGPGWRWAAGVTSVLAVLMALLVARFLTDSPHKIGIQPYGVAEGITVAAPQPASQSPAKTALSVLAMASRSWTFWALALTFWVCGWSTNGLVQTHFVPAAHDHGMAETTAAGMLAVVGIFDVIGTIASGWLTDRMDSRVLLAAYYGLRGASLLTVHHLLAPHVEPSLFVFIVFYGLDWVATVPPTVALCRQHFGLEKSGVVFGWVFAAHMVGAGVGASVAGWIREATGSYANAWTTAAVLCFASAVLIMTVPKTPRGAPAEVSATA